MLKVDYPEGFIDSDGVLHADSFYGHIKRGAVVEAYDGTIWTVVSRDFTGYGAIEGDVPEIAYTPDEELPQPTAVLREPYSSLKERPLGEWVKLVRQGNPEPVSKPSEQSRSAGRC